jgi:hypothetical protein
MKKPAMRRIRNGLLLASSLAAAGAGQAQASSEPVPPPPGVAAVHAGTAVPLDLQFRDPPASARPRVWWHWMNGNVTKDGIAKDIDWMSRMGIGGLQAFDAALATPKIVDHRLVYMSPEWKDAFRFAAQSADARGMELAIASSPGWSETGGPWVQPADGLKKVVWSETVVAGGKPLAGPLPPPPHTTGAFQDMGRIDPMAGVMAGSPPEFYTDIAVLAVPVPSEQGNLPLPVVSGPDGNPLDAAALAGASFGKRQAVPRGSAEQPSIVVARFDRPQTVRSVSLFLARAKSMFGGPVVAPRLEASSDGVTWAKVADVPVAAVPTTLSFAPVTATQFRLVLTPLQPTMSNMGSPAPGAIDGGLTKIMAGSAKAPFDLRHFQLHGEARVDRSEAKAGFAIEQDYYALGTPDAGATGPDAASVVNLTSKLRADGTLDWTPPAGSAWRILRFGSSLLGTVNHPAPAEATGLEVDKFDGAAVRRYMTHYLGMYRDAAGADMIGQRGVRALLTDSIEVGAANWTPRMIDQFKRLRGYDPTPWLPTLAGVLIGSRADADRFLYDWRRTLADLLASEHYGMVAQVAHENGLKVYGEALEDNRPMLGDDMAMRMRADVPMAALWTFDRQSGPNPSFLADMKGAASVSHIYGQNLVAAESMTSAQAPWAYTPKDLRRVIDLEFASGINRPVVHTSVHQPTDDKVPGLSLMIFGQYFNRHESWAEMARPWVDYMARNSLLLQQGRNVADVAYFYGEEAPLTGLYGKAPVADAPKAHAYDFVNADVLGGVLLNQGNELVSQGGARYRAIYLGGSSRMMTLKTLRRLSELVDGGANVIGLAPQGSPALDDAQPATVAQWQQLVARLWPGTGDAMVGKGRVIALANVDAGLARLGVAPDFRMAGAADAQVPFVHRQLADGDAWFLVNRLNREESFEGHFRVTGKQPELWHADSGKVEPVSYRIENGETIVPLKLAAESSVFVVFRKAATAGAIQVPVLQDIPLGPIAGAAKSGWTVAFQPGRGAPASLAMPMLTRLDQSADSGVRYFSGIATYTRSFRLPKGWKPKGKSSQPLWLDLGEVHDIAQVTVNGNDLGTQWHAPYRFDVAGAVHGGNNTVQVRVANSWVNRLIGDAQPGATKITWTAMPTYTASAPLQPSGLVGPVILGTTR